MHPEIDFHRVRTHNGTQHGGFEELCCQLASLNARPKTDVFIRKGLGGDAGVECIVRQPTGAEFGWQTKYVFQLRDAQIRKLDESISAALAAHPNLLQFYVCLPFDLKAPKPSKGRSERERWDAWRAKWMAKAKARRLQIELWDRSKLVGSLTQPNAANAGRLLYWFNALLLTEEWFRKHFERSKTSLGNRYSPDTIYFS